MGQIFNIIFQQIFTIYIGGTILYLYYKIKGRKVTYSKILNEVNPKNGLKKHAYNAFYLGVAFIIILVLIISTLAGFNPKIYDPSN